MSANDEKKWRVETVISILALVVSALSLWLSFFGVPGSVKPIKPFGYGIIRGVGPFPSDHILLPFEWENSSGQTVLIRQLYLRLRELSSNGQETDNEFRFLVAGEYPNVSTNSLQERYTILSSFTLPPRSVSLRVLVFHSDQWSNPTSPLYNFRLIAGQKYRVYAGFQQDLEQKAEVVLFDMQVHSGADKIDPAKWNFWYLGEGL